MLKNNLWSAVLILALSFMSTGLVAQTQTFNDIKLFKIRNTGIITSEKGINGYFSFYQLGKVDKKNFNYMLNILDENLTILSSKTIVAGKTSSVREVVYNGDYILVKMQDAKAKTYTYRMYDKNAEEASNKSYPVGYPYEYVVGNTKEEQEGQYLSPLEGKGFVNYSMKTKKKAALSKLSYIIHYFGNDKSTWEYKSDPEAKEYVYATFLGEKNNVLLSLVSKRKGLMSKDIEEFVLGIDLKTGTKLFENKIEDDKFASSTVTTTFDATSNRFVLHGFFFEKDAKTARAKSLGLSAFEMTEKGEIVKRKYNTWAGDFGKFLPTSERGKIEDVGYLFFHKFIQTADGKTYGIAEQYKKVASASGIAMNIIGGNGSASNTEIKTEDMYIIEFDKEYNITNVKVYDKTKSTVTIPAGYDFLPIRLLGTYIKVTGGFDYLYTQGTPDKSEFTIGYMDYERGGKENRGWTYGSINYSNGQFSTDKIKMNSKAKGFSVYPAKQGYVMIYEYFKKEKKVEFRLEKLN